MNYEWQEDSDKPEMSSEYLEGFASSDGKAFRCGTISFSRTKGSTAFVQGNWGSTHRSGEFKKTSG